MKNKLFFVLLILFVIFASTCLFAVNPENFLIKFFDAKMVISPSTGSMQVSAQDTVLTYCGDWEMVQVYPYLFHIRLKTWVNFYWLVNTSRKEVFWVTDGKFGGIGGTSYKLNINLEVFGGSASAAPNRIDLNFSDCYITYQISTGSMQFIAENGVLSYCQNWDRIKIYDYLVQMKLSTWSGFFWMVNTSRQEAYKVTGTAFGNLGGTQQKLNLIIEIKN